MAETIGMTSSNTQNKNLLNWTPEYKKKTRNISRQCTLFAVALTASAWRGHWLSSRILEDSKIMMKQHVMIRQATIMTSLPHSFLERNLRQRQKSKRSVTPYLEQLPSGYWASRLVRRVDTGHICNRPRTSSELCGMIVL